MEKLFLLILSTVLLFSGCFNERIITPKGEVEDTLKKVLEFKTLYNQEQAKRGVVEDGGVFFTDKITGDTKYYPFTSLSSFSNATGKKFSEDFSNTIGKSPKSVCYMVMYGYGADFSDITLTMKDFQNKSSKVKPFASLITAKSLLKYIDTNGNTEIVSLISEVVLLQGRTADPILSSMFDNVTISKGNNFPSNGTLIEIYDLAGIQKTDYVSVASGTFSKSLIRIVKGTTSAIVKVYDDNNIKLLELSITIDNTAPVPITTYTVVYCGNGNTGGSAPIDSNNYTSGQAVTILSSGTLTKTGYKFSGWNSTSNGSGISRAIGSTFNISNANVVLYALWELIPVPAQTYKYDFEADASGTVPQGATIIAGNIAVTTSGATALNGNYIHDTYNRLAVGTARGQISAIIRLDKWANPTADQVVSWRAVHIRGQSNDGFILRPQHGTTIAMWGTIIPGIPQGYQFLTNHQTSLLEIKKFIGTTSSQLTSAALKIGDYTYYRASAIGTTLMFEYSADGLTWKTACKATDSGIKAGNGPILYFNGLGSWDPDTAFVDDIELSQTISNIVIVPVESVTLNQHTINSTIGDTFQLTATVAPANATYKDIVWSTLDPAVATVSKTGLVTIVGNGTTVIKAQSPNRISDSCTLTVSTATVVDTEPDLPITKENYVGINLWGTVGWCGVRPFADLMKESRADWLTLTDTWHSSPIGKDSLGWPTEDGSIIIWEAEVQSAGIYNLIFTGKAQKLSLFNVDGTITDLNYNQSTNTTTAKLNVKNVITGGLLFSGTQRTPTSPLNSGVTNVRLYRPGYAADGTDVFTKEFLAAVKKFQVVRFMDWNSTNNNPTSKWSERTLPEHSSQSRHAIDPTDGVMGAGVAYEYMIQLCNATNTDMWVNLPCRADDDYIANLAKLIHYGRTGSDGVVYPPLNPNLKVYVEYGNEVWNFAGGFWNGDWVGKLTDIALANPNHPISYDGSKDHWQGLYRYVGWRLCVASEIFRSEFGDSQMMTRVRPVVESQVANPAWLQHALEFIENYYSVSRDGKPPRSVKHFVYGAGGSAYYGGGPTTYDANYIMSNLFNFGFADDAWKRMLQADAAMVRNYGLRRVAYEGGMGLDYYDSSGKTILTDAQYNIINTNPLMKDVMLKCQDAWSENDGELLCYYVLGGTNAWEFTSDRQNDATGFYSLTTPKMQAIDEIRSKNRPLPTLGNAIPGTIIVRDMDNNPMVITHWTGYANKVLDKPVYDGLKYYSMPVNAKVAGKYKMVLTGRIYGNPSNATDIKNGITEVRVNGKIAGNIAVKPAGNGVPDAFGDSIIELDIPEGFSMIRLKNNTGITLYSMTFSK